jgi:predicted nicotinamide N-methyase
MPPPPSPTIIGQKLAVVEGRLTLSENLLNRLIDEYNADDLAEILRAMQGEPKAARPVISSAPDSPWPWAAFWLAAGAVLCVWILTHPEWHP